MERELKERDEDGRSGRVKQLGGNEGGAGGSDGEVQNPAEELRQGARLQDGDGARAERERRGSRGSQLEGCQSAEDLRQGGRRSYGERAGSAGRAPEDPASDGDVGDRGGESPGGGRSFKADPGRKRR